MSAPSPAQPPPTRPKRSSADGTYKTLSAARGQADRAVGPSPLRKSIAALENASLNTLAVGRELFEDFRRRDRFFKYKFLILASWLVLSATSFWVACPGTAGFSGNTLKAQLVTTEVGSDTVYALRNRSDDPWLDVRVVVNGVWQLASPRVEPGEALTFETRRLTGRNGEPAPKRLLITDLVLRTEDGEVQLVSSSAVKPSAE